MASRATLLMPDLRRRPPAGARATVLVVAGALLLGSCSSEPEVGEGIESEAATRAVTACIRAQGVEPLGRYIVGIAPSGEVLHSSTQASIRGAPWFASSAGHSVDEVNRIVQRCRDQLEENLGPQPRSADPVPVPEAADALEECLTDNDITVTGVEAHVDSEGTLVIEAHGRGDPATASEDAVVEQACYEDIARELGFWEP